MTKTLTAEILKKTDVKRFHTPSHAGKIDLPLAQCDVTELSYTDNLLSPVSLLKTLEQNVASAYRAEACFISTQGATHNVLQAIYAVKEEGAFLIFGAAHASVYNALRALSLRAYHADKFDETVSIPSDVKTVVFTSPDYFGNTLPLEKIYPFFHEKNINVIVDSSHGAHFAFSSKLPVSATEYGDLVVVSLHKTLPVLTGGSALICKRIFFDKCFLARKIFHTTSPSFPTLCSIEKAIETFSKDGEKLYEKVFSAIENFKNKLPPPFSVLETDDKTRLVLLSPYDGERVSEILLEKGFAAEMSYENRVVFIVNPYNFDALDGLLEAVSGIVLPPFIKEDFPQKAHPKPTPMSFGLHAEAVPISEAMGRRSFLEIGFYPPGVPLLYAGDEITKEHIAYLSDEKAQKKVFGLENGKIYVVK